MFLRSLIFLMICGAVQTASAATWEVALLFLRAENSQEAQDIDRNLMELARIEPGSNLSLTFVREFPDRTVLTHLSTETMNRHTTWDSLFSRVPLAGVGIPATVVNSGPGSILDDERRLRGFLQTAFRKPGARRLFLIYGHGEGFAGLRGKSLVDLQKTLQLSLPPRVGMAPLDILWLDSCFMASWEALYQLRGLSRYFVASQDGEFSTGMPFDILADLQMGPADSRAVAMGLASRFIESYSFLRRGSQTGAVETSSATISVIDAQRLGETAGLFKEVAVAMRGKNLQKLVRSQPRLSMDQSSLVDAGRFLQTLLKVDSDPRLRSAVHALLKRLETARTAQVQKNPRLYLRPPVAGAKMLFGFDGWTRGFEGDSDFLRRLAPNFQPETFAMGPQNRRWPLRPSQARISLQPFVPGVNEFNVIFVDSLSGKPLLEPQAFRRHADFVLSTAQRPENPVMLTGHTLGVGTRSERYTGLNIADPTMGIPSLNYVETDFFQLTGWGQ